MTGWQTAERNWWNHCAHSVGPCRLPARVLLELKDSKATRADRVSASLRRSAMPRSRSSDPTVIDELAGRFCELKSQSKPVQACLILAYFQFSTLERSCHAPRIQESLALEDSPCRSSPRVCLAAFLFRSSERF